MNRLFHLATAPPEHRKGVLESFCLLVAAACPALAEAMRGFLLRISNATTPVYSRRNVVWAFSTAGLLGEVELHCDQQGGIKLTVDRDGFRFEASSDGVNTYPIPVTWDISVKSNPEALQIAAKKAGLTGCVWLKSKDTTDVVDLATAIASAAVGQPFIDVTGHADVGPHCGIPTASTVTTDGRMARPAGEAPDGEKID